MARADDIPEIPQRPESPNLRLTFSTLVRKKSLSRSQRSTDIISFARSKSQSAWSSVKIQLMKKTSMPELWRKWSPRWPSEAPDPQAALGPEEVRWPNDAEESLFCESLLGVMQRCGRFDYLSVDDDVQEKEKEEKVEKDDNRRRRSLFKQLRPNRNFSNTL